MKSENILQAINDIDPELVADAEGTHKKSAKRIVFRWSAVAACLLLIVGLVWEALAPPKIPVYENAMYTAEEIGNMLYRKTLGNGTSSYEKVLVPNTEYLYIQPIPDEKYLTIYQYNKTEKVLNKGELTDLVDIILARFASELGEEMPAYKISEPTSLYSNSKALTTDNTEFAEHSFYASQSTFRNFVSFSANHETNPTREIVLGDVHIQVDQTQSDAQIINSLSAVKDKLFSILGVSFSDIRIVRRYDEWANNGVSWMYIYFYNESDHPLNAIYTRPVSDYIELSFDNTSNWAGDMVSDTVLQDVSVFYYQYRSDVSERYTPSKQIKRISLEDAEALLYNGYVFGGHSCKLCMAAQGKVDFTDYDYVGFTYVQGNDDMGDETELIPFYVFYKRIGTGENGNEIYARTYVPAIEVSGYEEYFKSQEAKHNIQ